MINGYPDRPSVKAGEQLILHVATGAPWFRVDFYRQGATLAAVGSSPWLPGQPAADGSPGTDWGWPPHSLAIPRAWPSGVYIAVFVEGDNQQVPVNPTPVTGADARSGRALFVVRSAAPGSCASILYKLSLNTFHAYNFAGGGSLYDSPEASQAPPGSKVTMHRPGGGTGGPTTPTDAGWPDGFDSSTPRQTFAHWDAPFVAWLEANGYAVEYCVDLDLHENPDNLLDTYDLLLSVGHDEYWSEEMRGNLEAFISSGGNVAFFSGNTCWWRVHFVDGNTAFVCDKSVHAGDGVTNSRPYALEFDKWHRFHPENSLTGVSYRNAGGWWWNPDRPSQGYLVHHPNHWIYDGTGLAAGDVFGGQATEALVGYECDGALLSRRPDNEGFASPDGSDGTPANFTILGVAALPPGWAQDPGGYPGGMTATMGVYDRNGVVFTAATTDWSRLLATNAVVDRITRNVLEGLAGVRGTIDAVDVTSITGQHCATPLTSWQVPDGPDIVEHLAGVNPNGDVVLFYWTPQSDWQTVNVSQLAGEQGSTQLTSWQTPDGPYLVEHLAGVSPKGDVLVFYWSPQADWQAINVSQITGEQGASPLTSWQTPNGPYVVEHLAGMSPAGDLLVFYWSPRADWRVVNVTQRTRRKIAGPATSWLTPDGPYLVEHLAAMSPGGDVLVFYWSPKADWQVVNVSQITGEKIAGPMTSWLTWDGPYLVEHLAAMSPSGDLLVFYWSPQADWQVVNVSQITGERISGPVTSWQQPQGPFNVEKLGATAPDGTVLVFSWIPATDWQVRRITDCVGGQLTPGLTSWQVPDGPNLAEHLAGVTADQRVLLYYWW